MSKKSVRYYHNFISKGFSLVEILVALGLVAVIGAALASVITSASKQQKGIQAKDQQREVSSEIRTMLSDRTACMNSFGGLDPDAAGTPKGFTVTTIKDGTAAPGVTKYTVNTNDKTGLLTFKEFRVTNWNPDAIVTQGTADFLVKLSKVDATSGTSTSLFPDVITLRIRRDATTKKITDCFSIGKQSDGVWQITASNANNIMYKAGNVGVGTDVPASTLDVQTNLQTAPPAFKALNVNRDFNGNAIANSATAYIGGSDVNYPDIGIYIDQKDGSNFGDNSSYILNAVGGSAGTSQFVVTGAGNVGIGTGNPGNLLEVYKNQNANTAIRIRNDNPGTGAFAQVEVTNNAAGGAFGIQGTGNTGSANWNGNDTYVYGSQDMVIATTGNAAANSIRFSTKTGPTVERMRITNAGDVGIGTTNPATPLHVSSPGAGAVVLAIGSDATDAGVQSAIELVTANGGTKRLDNASTKGWQISGVGNTYGSGPNRNDLRFAYWDGATMSPGVFRTNMLISSVNGNVGIGTTTPTNLLTVMATNPADGIAIKASSVTPSDPGDIIFLNNDNSERSRIHSGNAASGILAFQTTGADRVIIDSAGYVGIGTAPANPLHVNGSARLGLAGQVSLYMAVPGISGGAIAHLCYDGFTGAVDACPSLRKFKTDIQPLDIGLETVLKLNPVSYKWKANGQQDIGFIAEEAVQVDSRFGEQSTEHKLSGVKYDHLVALLAKAIQELFAKMLGFEEILSQQSLAITTLQADKSALQIRTEKIELENAAIKKYLCEKDPRSNFCITNN